MQQTLVESETMGNVTDFIGVAKGIVVLRGMFHVSQSCGHWPLWRKLLTRGMATCNAGYRLDKMVRVVRLHPL